MKTNTTDFRAFLQSELLRRSKNNPSYSLRAFARNLKMDHSTLVKILSGKREVGKRATLRIAEQLGLSLQEAEHFVTAKATDSVGGDYRQLTLDSFSVISDWYHFAILEVIRTDDFRPDVGWISRVLGISRIEATEAIERLRRLHLIETDEQGRWFQPEDSKSTTMGSPFTARAFRNLQRQILERAITAMEEVPIELRDQTSMTLAIDVSRIPEAKKKITEFRRELSAYLSRGDRRDEVYHLSLSLYPVSQISQKISSIGKE